VSKNKKWSKDSPPRVQPLSSSAASAPVGAARPELPLAEAERVRQLLAHGTVKQALETAKELHKKFGTAESEQLLVDAYLARIHTLREQRMTVEAEALVKLVEERYPASRDRLTDLHLALSVQSGKLDDLLRPLNDANLPADRRALTETLIRQQVTDLAALAQCAVLPSGHPLREGAAALRAAFEAVTSGPVADDALTLPQVSHRSPLASWKMLARAIAAWYRGDADASVKWVQAIAADSVPARLVPALKTLLRQNPEVKLTAGAAALVAETGGDREALRPALTALDKLLDDDGSDQQILGEIRRVLALARQHCPELVERLKQHISIRCMLADLEFNQVMGAIGGMARKDAHFFRLYARALESRRDPEDYAQAALLWEEFRKHAIREGWFPANGPEEATVLLHAAKLIEEVPEDDFAPPEIGGGPATLAPERIYGRACSMDPHPEAFRQWLDWAREQEDWRPGDRAAEQWHRARPLDVEPLLYLSEAAEKRGSFKKALDFLEEAERLDRVNPEARKTRLRLLVSTAIRHLKQKKPHLAEEGIRQLEELPEMRTGDRPAFVAALRWGVASVRYDRTAMAALEAEAQQRMETPAAAYLLLNGISRAATGIDQPGSQPPKIKASERASLAAGVARACALGDSMGVPFTIPSEWQKSLTTALTKSEAKLDAALLRALGEAALRRGDHELAYAATAAGLRQGGADARFLFIRAQALPIWLFDRRDSLLAAAAELARRQHDMDLVNEILEMQRRRNRRGFFGLGSIFDPLNQYDFTRQPRLLETIVEDERRLGKPPAAHPGPQFRSGFGNRGGKPCQCPECRRERGEFADEDADDALDALDDLFSAPGPGKVPPEMIEAMAEAIARGEGPDEFLERLKSEGLPGQKKQRRDKKPELEKLFGGAPNE